MFQQRIERYLRSAQLTALHLCPSQIQSRAGASSPWLLFRSCSPSPCQGPASPDWGPFAGIGASKKDYKKPWTVIQKLWLEFSTLCSITIPALFAFSLKQHMQSKLGRPAYKKINPTIIELHVLLDINLTTSIQNCSCRPAAKKHLFLQYFWKMVDTESVKNWDLVDFESKL